MIIKSTQRSLLSLQPKHPYPSPAWFESRAEMSLSSFGSISTMKYPSFFALESVLQDFRLSNSWGMVLNFLSFGFFTTNDRYQLILILWVPQTRTGTHLWKCNWRRKFWKTSYDCTGWEDRAQCIAWCRAAGRFGHGTFDCLDWPKMHWQTCTLTNASRPDHSMMTKLSLMSTANQHYKDATKASSALWSGMRMQPSKIPICRSVRAKIIIQSWICHPVSCFQRLCDH